MKRLLAVTMFSFSVLLFLALAGPAPAATRTWLGSTDTNWNTAGNWSGGAVPTNGEAVIIPNQAIDPSMPPGTNPATGSYASFELQAGASNTCLGDTGVVNEASGGTTNSYHGIGVTINVSGNATIAGILNADGKGFPAQRGPGTMGDSFEGAGHGGRGGGSGVAEGLGGGGAIYGTNTQPTALGSGARSAGNCGGGAIKMNVGGTLDVSGEITADGLPGTYGGSSGGSVWLIAAALTGGGKITAEGGDVGQAEKGSGGGGRIALDYNTGSFTGTVSAAGGHVKKCGQPGTLWEPRRFVGQEGSAAAPRDMMFRTGQGYQYYFTNGSPTCYWNLTVSNEWMEFHKGSLVINNLLLTNSVPDRMNAVLRFDKNLGGTDNFDMQSLSVTGNIVMNGARLCLPAEGTYNLAGNLNCISTNAILDVFSSTTNANEASGGTAANPHGIGVTIRVGGNATLNGTISGAIYGAGYGFAAGKGPGYSGGSVGGTHGGKGVGSTFSPYGSLTQPTALGSGGLQNPGGGAIKLAVTNTLTLNGTLTAKGGGGYFTGAGGSIWLIADTFAGGGTINADGGTGREGDPTGGGGRLAIEYRTTTFGGTITIAAGAGGATAKTGTWFNCVSPFRGTYTTGGYAGVSLASVFGISSNGVKITRGVTRWGTAKLAWTEQSTDILGSSLANTVNYTLSGLTPQIRYCMFTNDFPMGSARSSAAGILTISNFPLSGTAIAIRVEIPPKGTILNVQ